MKNCLVHLLSDNTLDKCWENAREIYITVASVYLPITNCQVMTKMLKTNLIFFYRLKGEIKNTQNANG